MKLQNPKKAFSLIEMAIVLVIIGILVGLIAPIVTDVIKREKTGSARDYVEQVRDEIVGFALINKRLPTASELGTKVDVFGNELVYEASSDMTADNFCTTTPGAGTLYTVTEHQAGGGTSPYNDIAFLIASPGRNLAQEFGVAGQAVTTYDPRAWTPTTASEEYDDIVEFVSFNYLKNKVCTNVTNQSVTPPGADVSFAQNIGAFAGGASGSGTEPFSSGSGSVTVNVEDGTIELASGSSSNGLGCVWYQGDNPTGNCSASSAGDGRGDGTCDWGGGLRAYFTFKLDNETPGNARGYGGGFTFAIINGENSVQSCGQSTISTADLGYSSNEGVGSGDGVAEPKLAVEVDTVQDGSKCDPAFNHSALVFWASGDEDNEHGLTYFGANLNGTTPVADSDGIDPLFATNNPTGTTLGACPATAVNTLGFTNGSAGLVTWLEDGLEHNMRVEVYVDPTAANRWINASVWVDCSNCMDLTSQWANNATPPWPTQQQVLFYNDNWPSGHNGYTTAGGQITPTDNHTWIRFGWTMASGGATADINGQTVTLSNFGIKFLDE